MNTKTLSLVKDGHKYVFRYTAGSENHVVDEIIRLAEDSDSNLDWLDAATLSFQVARNAAMECRRTLKTPQKHHK